MKTLSVSENIFFIYVLTEILLKYRKKLIRYVRIFGTTILQNKSVSEDCFWRHNSLFWIMYKCTTWSYLNQSNPVSENITWCYCRENIRCYAEECRSLAVNVHIEEDLIFKFLSVSTVKYQANKTEKVEIFHITVKYI